MPPASCSSSSPTDGCDGGESVSNPSFETCRNRLAYLELWHELAIRPNSSACSEDDRDLLSRPDDDLEALSKRCIEVRRLMNNALPVHNTKFDNDLIPAGSAVESAGLGLFYKPSSESAAVLRKGEVICYYYGRIHNFHSAKHIKDKSYLMLVGGDVLVDPAPLHYIKARYINDPINSNFFNCRFEPEPKAYRSAVIATRDIHAGEEIFVPYGEAYWSQQTYEPTILTQQKATIK